MIKNMSSLKDKGEKYTQAASNNDEIDLRPIISFFFRNRLFLSIFSLFFFVLAILYSFTMRKIWEGQFQIVLNSQEDTRRSQIQFNPILSDIAGLSQKNNLKTEVGILESPSVLKPIYELAISQNNNIKDKNIISFSQWKKNLKVQLEKGTSILNIAYRDKDKNIILPVLNEMTSTYQEYSGRNKKRVTELTKNYIKNQIILFKDKSSNSLRKVQEFAIDQDLIYFDINKSTDATNKKINVNSNSGLLIPNIGIENLRVQAANDIRKINLQILKIGQLNNTEELQYIGSTIPALVEEGLPQALKDIDENLVELRSKYTEQDRTITRLLEKRELTKNFLKERAINYLKAAKLQAEARMEAAMRPKGVLLKYKELIREAERDESTLIELENQLRAIELDASKIEDPWELITKPTLLDSPVSSSKKTISIIGFFIGIILSSLIAFIREKKSEKIFTKEKFEKLLMVPCLETINTNTIDKDLLYFKEFLRRKSFKKLSFIFKGNFDDELINKFKKSISEDSKLDENIGFINENDELINFSNTYDLILLTTTNEVNVSEIKNLKKKINILDKNFVGFILIEKFG